MSGPKKNFNKQIENRVLYKNAVIHLIFNLVTGYIYIKGNGKYMKH